MIHSFHSSRVGNVGNEDLLFAKCPNRAISRDSATPVEKPRYAQTRAQSGSREPTRMKKGGSPCPLSHCSAVKWDQATSIQFLTPKPARTASQSASPARF